MTLKKVLYQDWNSSYSYAPPLMEAVINTDHVSSAEETNSRGSGPWTKVRFNNGQVMIIQGKPEDLL